MNIQVVAPWVPSAHCRLIAKFRAGPTPFRVRFAIAMLPIGTLIFLVLTAQLETSGMKATDPLKRTRIVTWP
ncbi:hypothetical protein RVV79_001664 [Burkholderia contaminans]|uniref:hypothetical protein n=1 Tax=Burkholderia contaminans TaxID=488447 RepID=UPI00158A2DB7|nr:hypothetical protein [Burkholderia contaminans]ELK6463026.1 hypothetical protein [Burkholderia contaminans]